MKNFKNKCDIAYELGNPLIPDSDYDSLFGHNATALSTSHHHDAQTVTLPFWMGSLNKIKTEKALSLWLRKNSAKTFVISCKLDGISALYHNNKLFTRGNGVKGCNISTFLEYLSVGAIISLTSSTLRASPDRAAQAAQRSSQGPSLRGELVMKKNVFEEKYNKKFKNPRNLVAGQFTKKEIDISIVEDIDFVAYEIINPDQQNSAPALQLLPSVQFNLINDNQAESQRKEQKHDNSVKFRIVDRKDLTIENLNNIFNEFVISSNYVIDGLVITANEVYIRNTSGNPKYSFAFKKDIETQTATAIVTKIQWTLSKWGVYIPVVHIVPVELSGCTISKLTGHNAKYIVENKIEEGAEIICVRSGDVIPYILEVVKPSVKNISLPDGYWDGVHIKRYLDGINSAVEIKILTSLLTKLEVKNINIKTVEKLYNNFCSNDQKKSGIDVFFKIVNCDDDSLSEIFKNKTRSNILSELVSLKLRPIHISTLISASGLLGYGLSDKRIELLFTRLPYFLNSQPSIQELCSIEGFSVTLAQKIFDNYFPAIHFTQTCQNILNVVISNSIQDGNQETKKIKICQSGFRDKTLNKHYTVLNSVTKDCEFLVVVDELQSGSKAKETIKVKQARKLNIPIISRLQFEEQISEKRN